MHYITKADKTSSVVIINTSDYISQARRWLHNANFYKVLQLDPTLNFQQKISKFLEEASVKDLLIMTSIFLLNPTHGAQSSDSLLKLWLSVTLTLFFFQSLSLGRSFLVSHGMTCWYISQPTYRDFERFKA